MTGYIIRRLGQSIIVTLGVLFIMFVLQSLLPNPARAILGVKATRAQINAFIQQNDLNKPFYVQFAHYVVNVVWHHDLGQAKK